MSIKALYFFCCTHGRYQSFFFLSNYYFFYTIPACLSLVNIFLAGTPDLVTCLYRYLWRQISRYLLNPLRLYFHHHPLHYLHLYLCSQSLTLVQFSLLSLGVELDVVATVVAVVLLTLAFVLTFSFLRGFLVAWYFLQMSLSFWVK